MGDAPMVELNGVRIWAIGLDAGTTRPARKLPCGTLARPLGGDPRPGAAPMPGRLPMPGRPDVSVAWTGWFALPTGEAVAVYGAVVAPVGWGGPPGAPGDS